MANEFMKVDERDIPDFVKEAEEMSAPDAAARTGEMSAPGKAGQNNGRNGSFKAEQTDGRNTSPEADQNRHEVTIKFGRGLVGEPFASRNGKELVSVSIPNPDRQDIRPWETFVISPKMIHENKFGKGVWMKLPEDGTTRLSRSVKIGVDENGKNKWGSETREVSNTELKSLLEAYKTKDRGSVLSDLSDRKAEGGAGKTSGKTAKNRDTAR